MSTQSSVDLAPIPHVLWETVIPAGTHWSGVLRRGMALRVVDIEGGANLAAVFYRHDDPLGGVGDAELFASKYGVARYQQHRNAMIRNGRDSLLLELAKHGLGTRDLMANINFFSKLAIGDDGALDFVAGHSAAGAALDLRFEMDTLAALSSAPHPLNPSTEYDPRPVKLIAYRAYAANACVPADDPCRAACAENERGFVNTDRLFV
jgi:uncharacterized protein YcgI (DUF1989 family)